MSYRSKWEELTSYYGTLCYYCRDELATTIDHVVPYSYDQDNSIENLVPACALCNLLASNKHFEDVEQKRQYIVAMRKHRASNRTLCILCSLPFAYREHSPSFTLCAECYDDEYGTNYAASKNWKQWIDTCWEAGIIVEAHRRLRGGPLTKGNGKHFVYQIISNYEDYYRSCPSLLHLDYLR